jgi:glycogen synthase
MVHSFAAQISKKEVRINWVSCFLKRHQERITRKWTTRMDRVHHRADSESSYSQYFIVLKHKLEIYNILQENVYNMDEKGFMLGTRNRSLRIFNKASWKAGRIRKTL